MSAEANVEDPNLKALLAARAQMKAQAKEFAQIQKTTQLQLSEGRARLLEKAKAQNSNVTESRDADLPSAGSTSCSGKTAGGQRQKTKSEPSLELPEPGEEQATQNVTRAAAQAAQAVTQAAPTPTARHATELCGPSNSIATWMA